MHAPEHLSARRWARLVPVAFITYSLAYVDRANFSLGAAGGMAGDLHISGNSASLVGALFFLGYFLFQIPAARYAERDAKRLMFWSMLLWGVCATLTGIVSDIRLLYLVRFFLGVMESAALPGMIVFLSHWFTAPERSRANAFLILGNPITVLWMSVLSGYLIQFFGWRGMFVIEGLPPILWAFLWRRLVENRPEEVAWLEPGEAAALNAQLRAEQSGIPAVKNYSTAFRSPIVILLAAQYFCWSLGLYGFVLWLPSILKAGTSMGIVGIGWLSAAPYLLAAFLMVACSFASDRLLVRKPFIWPPLLMGAAAFYGSYLLGGTHYWLSFALLVLAGGVMYAPYGPFFAFISETLPRNVAGGATALINSAGALGSFAGSYAVGALNAATGGTQWSFGLMAMALLAAVLLTVLVGRRPPAIFVAGQA
jgi:sugar phosphate permease